MNKQEAYNRYADLFSKANEAAKQGNLIKAQTLYIEAEEWWDLYFYWDDTEE